MKFLIIFGPGAVGKMTVGHELQKLTGMKLFHNHMTIDLVSNFFTWGDPQFKLVSEFRKRIFEEVASSDMHGLIFTYVWALDEPSDKRFIDECVEIFRRNDAEIFFVELEANQAVRLERNKTAFRLERKPPKRDLIDSEKGLLKNDKKYKLNSSGDFFYEKNYLKVNNTNLSATEVAEKIADTFSLQQQKS